MHVKKKPAAGAYGLFGLGKRVRYRLRPSGDSSSASKIFFMPSMYHKFFITCEDLFHQVRQSMC
jgi:hypothetical protein